MSSRRRNWWFTSQELWTLWLFGNVVKFKRDINTNCSFCEDHPETVLHLFWYCSHTKTFWQNFSRFIFYKSQSKDKMCFIINLLILLAKFHIHKCKFSTKKTYFVLFLHEVVHYINLISGSNNKKAIKTFNICSSFSL